MDPVEQLVALVVAGVAVAAIVVELLVIARRDRRHANGRTSQARTIASTEPVAVSAAPESVPPVPLPDAPDVVGVGLAHAPLPVDSPGRWSRPDAAPRSVPPVTPIQRLRRVLLGRRLAPGRRPGA